MDASPVLIDVLAVAAMLGVSRNSVWKLQAAGRLGPRPVRLGRCTRWRRLEVLAWIDADCPSRDQWEIIAGRKL